MPSKHGEQLRARGPRRSHVEVLHREVGVVGVTKINPPAERQPLARGVGDGVAEARAAQELGGREGLPVVQHDPLARLPHRDEATLGHLPARPRAPATGAWSAAGWFRRDPAPGAPAAPPPPERAAGSPGP